MTQFTDKVIVVTGAGRGQGAREAKLLRDRAATVIACDLDFPERTDDSHRMALGTLICGKLDVTDAAGWEALRDELEREFGQSMGL